MDNRPTPPDLSARWQGAALYNARARVMRVQDPPDEPDHGQGILTRMSILDDKTDVLADLVHGIDATYRGGLDTVQALRMIRDTAESALTQAVDQARAEGASWDQIGRALATSRQSAHERYSGTPSRRTPNRP